MHVKSFFKSNGGFTLAELLIAVTILGLLTSTVISSSVHVLQTSRDAKRLADMEAIESALAQFFLDEGFYPGPNQTLKDGITRIHVDAGGVYVGVDDRKGITNPNIGGIDDALAPYMDTVPRDPLHDGIKYYYAYDPQHYQSAQQDCMDDKLKSHPLHYSKIGLASCNCSVPAGDVTTAIFGFYRAENPVNIRDRLELATCAGGNMNLDEAHWNRKMLPMPN